MHNRPPPAASQPAKDASGTTLAAKPGHAAAMKREKQKGKPEGSKQPDADQAKVMIIRIRAYALYVILCPAPTMRLI